MFMVEKSITLLELTELQQAYMETLEDTFAFEFYITLGFIDADPDNDLIIRIDKEISNVRYKEILGFFNYLKGENIVLEDAESNFVFRVYRK